MRMVAVGSSLPVDGPVELEWKVYVVLLPPASVSEATVLLAPYCALCRWGITTVSRDAMAGVLLCAKGGRCEKLVLAGAARGAGPAAASAGAGADWTAGPFAQPSTNCMRMLAFLKLV